jgi:hypothetical protein
MKNLPTGRWRTLGIRIAFAVAVSVACGARPALAVDRSSTAITLALPGASFESPTVPSNPGYVYGPSFGPWTFADGAGLSGNGTAFTSGNPSAPQGNQVLFLQGGTATARQTITFARGLYSFSYSAAQRGNLPATQGIQLRIDGNLVHSTTPSGASYQSFSSIPVMLSSGAHTVELRGTNSFGDHTAFVDNLTATRVTQIKVTGFESPVITEPSGFVYRPTGGTWIFSGDAGLSRSGTGFTSGNPTNPEGAQVLFLQGSNSTARADLNIPYAGYFRFRFRAALRANDPAQPPAKSIRLTAGGVVAGEFALPSTAYTEQVSLVVYLGAGPQSVRFSGIDTASGDHTGFVDDVRLETVLYWHDPAVWSGNTVPGVNDNATVPAGSVVCMQGVMTPRSITVHGELLAAQNDIVNIRTKQISVMGTGSLFEIGQERAPFNNAATITLNATASDPQDPHMGGNFISAMTDGVIRIHGENRVSWTQLAANVPAGTRTLTLKEPVNWRPGDKIVVVSSRESPHEAEQRTVTSVSGNVIDVDASLTYPHTGVVKTYNAFAPARQWNADLRAQVGLLTHNITIQGEAAAASSGFGGHMMIMGSGRAYVSGVELNNMGQKGRLARYPFHWHMQGNLGAGQYFKNSSVHHSFNRALTIHGTESTLVENNFFYDHIGHGLFLEDGSERFNVIRKNVVALSRRPARCEAVTLADFEFDQAQNRTPANYWITNPQNIFEDNVAAGTEGTGFWFIFPESPLGLSANDSRFAGLHPWASPLLAFRRNSAHSTKNAFDIFDRVVCADPNSSEICNPLLDRTQCNHTIVPNLGWNDQHGHMMEQCTWYANDTAIYTGIGAGGPSDNLYFTDNVFVDNRVGTMLASYAKVSRAVFVADSGEGLLGGDRYAYRVYDGAGSVEQSHFVGWNAANTNFLMNTGAGTKHVNHIFGANTSDTGIPRVELEDFDVRPVEAHANHPGHPRFWSIVLRDLNGGISGKANTSMLSNHPFLLVGDEHRPSNWTRAFRSDHRFALSKLHYGLAFEQIPPVVCTRSKPGTASESIYYIYGYSEHHQLPFLANEGYEYTYTYESLPTTQRVHMEMDDAVPGDNYVVRFKDFGKLSGLAVSSTQPSITQHHSLANLRGAPSSAYYIVDGGDLYIKAVAMDSYQMFNITWGSSAFVPPAVDTDGDLMADRQEIIAGRHPFQPGDSESEFDEGGNLPAPYSEDGWSPVSNISNMQVWNGFLTGVSTGNGDAVINNENYNFRAQGVRRLYVRMKASQATGVEFFFATSASGPGYSAGRRVAAWYSGNGAYQTLTFDMGSHPDWRDTVTDLRFDPVSGSGISFEIDWIRAGCPQENDADRDGICNAEDRCPGFDDQLIGTSCNDGNASTFPDAWSSSCVCTQGAF